MAVSETQNMAMWNGIAGLTSFVGMYSLHEAVAQGYSAAIDVEWRQMFPCHGGTAGVLMLAGGAGYSLSRGKLTPEGASIMGLGASLMLSDINDVAVWFETIWDALFYILIAFLVGLTIGLIIRLLEKSTENVCRSVA